MRGSESRPPRRRSRSSGPASPEERRGTFQCGHRDIPPIRSDCECDRHGAPIATRPHRTYVATVAAAEASAHAPALRRSRSPLAANLAILAGSQAVTWCASAVWAVVVPRTLGAYQTGVYTFAVAAGGVLTVAIGLGLRPLLVREIALDPGRSPRLVGAAIVLR